MVCVTCVTVQLSASNNTVHGTRMPKLYVVPMYVGGGRYWGHVRRNPFGKTDGHLPFNILDPNPENHGNPV